jgi:hypothetical protein
MKKEELDILLDKYYSGTTSEEEEELLRTFFISAEVLPGYETEAEIFRYMKDASAVPEPSADLDSRIIIALDNSLKKSKITSLRRRYSTLSGIAAGILIIIASWFFLDRINESADTFDDPEMAYAAAVNILYEVSGRLNKGLQTIEPVARMNTGPLEKIGEFEKSVDLAGRELQSLDHLERVIEMTGNSDEQ